MRRRKGTCFARTVILFQTFHFLLAFLFFPITWGICFSFSANPKSPQSQVKIHGQSTVAHLLCLPVARLFDEAGVRWWRGWDSNSDALCILCKLLILMAYQTARNARTAGVGYKKGTKMRASCVSICRMHLPQIDQRGLIFPVGHLEPRALSAFDDSRYSRVYDAPS